MQPHGARAHPEIDGRVRPGRRLFVNDGRRHDKALVAAPAHAELEKAQRVAEPLDVDAAVDLETKQARAAGELAPVHRSIEGRMQHARDPRMLTQRGRYGGGAALVRAHPELQRPQPAHQQPALERRQLGAEIGQHDPVEVADQFGRACDHAGHRVAVAAQILGGRVDDEVGAVLQRPLKDRARPAIVDDRHRTFAPGDGGQPGDVLNLEHPAGRGLEVEHAGVDERPFHGCEVAPVDIVDRDAHPRQQHLEETVGVGVDVAHADHAVAAAHLAQHGATDRGHAAGEAARGLGPLHPRQLVLEHAGRRIADPAVDRLPGAAGEGRTHLVVGFEGEQRGLVEGRDHGAFGEARVVGEDGRRVGPVEIVLHARADRRPRALRGAVLGRL